MERIKSRLLLLYSRI